jgi:hypothetical protein
MSFGGINLSEKITFLSLWIHIGKVKNKKKGNVTENESLLFEMPERNRNQVSTECRDEKWKARHRGTVFLLRYQGL